MTENQNIEQAISFSIKFARSDGEITPVHIGNWVDGTYSGTNWTILRVYFVKHSRMRVLGFSSCGRGIQLIWNARCCCRVCRANVWRRLFFMRPHDPRLQ